MAYLVNKGKTGLAVESIFFEGLAKQILENLKVPKYPTQIAKELKVHEQKIYYHIRKLEKLGCIEVKREEEIKGSSAKFYGLVAPIIYQQIGELHEGEPTHSQNNYLKEFISEGILDARIVVGSPDPHGPEKARSRDGYYGIDLGLFLGKFIHTSKHPTILDTEFREEYWQDNLILLGGPVTNRVVNTINRHLPVFFHEEKQHVLFSKNTQREYSNDEIGIIQKIKNPFNPKKYVLVLAGKRYQGTRAAIIAFTKRFSTVTEKDSRVIEGIDLDSDGIIDEVEFLE